MTNEWTTLGSVTTWLSGGTPARSNPAYWGGSVPWISAFTLKTTRLRTSDQFLTSAGVAAGSRIAPEGATLVLVRGMALHRELRVGLATRPLAFNQDVKALVPAAGLEPEFLVYSLQSRENQILKLVSSAGSGTGVLASDRLMALPLWLPSRDVQQRICRAIRDADDLIGSLERLIAKKRDIKQGLMQELLTGTTRLPGFSGQWSKSTVGDVAWVKTGPFGSALHEEDYVSTGTPIITVEHIGEFGVSADGAPMVSADDRWRLRSYTLREGDVVFSRVGSIDRNARIGKREAGWLFSGRILRVRFDASVADSLFMSYQLRSATFRERVRSVAVGQTMPSLNTKILSGIPIVLPPLVEQSAISAVLSDADTEITALERRLEAARGVKAGMMQKLLTGRTRLSLEAAS